MTLYEFIKMEQADFDTFDTVFDICVTVCEPYVCVEEEEEYYDKFYDFILKNVDVVEKTGECTCICKWYDFIKNNIEVFRKAANDMWYEGLVPDNEEDLIYEWIKDMEGWLAGYVSEDSYKNFMEKYADKIKEGR